MANFFPDDSLQRNLTQVKTGRLDGASLCLAKADVADAAGNLAADYTAHECDFAGYARITLNSWGAVGSGGTGIGETDETVRTFTRSTTGAAQTVYVVFVLDTGGFLVYAERLTLGTITLTNAGDTFNYKPIVKDSR